MTVWSSSVVALMASCLAGCFAAHELGDEGATRDAGRSERRDARVAPDLSADLGPVGPCTCASDADCGEPPPFGCGRAVCVFEASCAIGTRDEGCEPGARCDPAGLECVTEAATVEVVLRTDYRPGVEFDGVAVRANGAVVALAEITPGDDSLDGVRVGSFGTIEEATTLEVELYAGCVSVASRRVRLALTPPEATEVTVVLTR